MLLKYVHEYVKRLKVLSMKAQVRCLSMEQTCPAVQGARSQGTAGQDSGSALCTRVSCDLSAEGRYQYQRQSACAIPLLSSVN